MEKFKKTVFIAIFVSLASQVKFNFITDGFIIAMSVVVFAIFIYCYEDLSPIYIGICACIFSPLFRLFISGVYGGEFAGISLRASAALIIPDMAFFFFYGICYTLIYKHVVKKPKDIRNFPYVILACDFLSNTVELTARCLVQGQNVFTVTILLSVFMVAICRTLLIQMILLAMEFYSNLLLKQEHDREYRRLIVQASIFESELYVMEKNAAEIEDIMRQSFALYKSIEAMDLPRELKTASLEVSKNAHEVKGDYLNIITVLKETFVDDIDETRLSMRDMIAIEKSNITAYIKSKGYNIELNTKVRVNFYVKQYFKMMSVVRNLILNSTEAIGERGGRISLILRGDGERYILTVRDNGPGISEEALETVFIEGYSTKFSQETGNVQRGLGLTLVKDYVENYFHGEIAVTSEKNRFTEFNIVMPKGIFEEEENEVLPD
ncbi:MAG: ATP-binding protein [Emergencia sp.]|nr:ATP-binding protein [Emergencia sp.]